MCRMASFFFQPIESVPVRVLVLDDHSETARKLKLGDIAPGRAWREGHYSPDGEIECRILEGDVLSSKECVAEIRFRFPKFVDFFNWAMQQPGVLKVDGSYDGDLYLSGLTSAEGLKLPSKLNYLYLNGLTSAEGLKLPSKLNYLYLPDKIRKALKLFGRKDRGWSGSSS